MPQLEQQPAPRGKLARFNEIVTILLRNDAWGLVRSMTSPPPEGGEEDEAPVQLRQTLEELGPSFIKIGQLLATRPDLVPDRYVTELKKLYDKTTPSPYDEVRAVVRRELGRDIEQVFASFEPEAIASASIGQVHRATLKDGTKVAVKVQHVGIEEAMELDFEILRGLVSFVEKTFAASRLWQPREHLEELRLMLERELDYTVEMRNTQRVEHNFRHHPEVHIPQMYPALCTKRLLVMEFIEGVKFTRVDVPEMQGVDRTKIAAIVTHAMARQIFIHRLFHADPSPGNMMILPPDRVAFLDFGAVGAVTERRARAILRLISSFSKGDVEGACEAIIDLCEQRGEFDPKAFQTDVEKLLDFFEREGLSVADPRLMELILGVAKKHRMLLPPDFVLISRALFQFEGFCRELDPGFNLVEVLEPFVAELLWKKISSPSSQKELMEETVGELLRFARSLPHTLNTLVRKVERNELSTRVEVAGLEGLKASQGRGILKMSFTVMMAALVIGLGIVFAAPVPDDRAGQFLFAAGGLLLLWTLVMIVWSEAFKGNRE
ncbi:MAG TPA: AarF/UbiB family protein [Candidatus Thermoplasmatota archaeon]|nr:AarF/UbiB family protein [Candidatus Thermoplasmatota archaeon]